MAKKSTMNAPIKTSDALKLLADHGFKKTDNLNYYKNNNVWFDMREALQLDKERFLEYLNRRLRFVKK